MEADLAFRGVDFRDFWLPGGGESRLSMRRLFVLLRGFPAETVTHQRLRVEQERADATRKRGRMDHYKSLRASQEADGGES